MTDQEIINARNQEILRLKAKLRELEELLHKLLDKKTPVKRDPVLLRSFCPLPEKDDWSKL